MRGLLASLLGVTLIAVTNWGKVNAVFDDEAYAIDWHSSNIGKYKCVLPASNEAHVDQLLILSAYDSGSMLSWVNKTNGELLDRLPLDINAQDAMLLDDGEVVLRQYNGSYAIFDGMSGLRLEDRDLDFSSSCQPDLSMVRIQDGKVTILDTDSGLGVYEVDLPLGLDNISFLQHNEEGSLEILLSTIDGNYTFTQFSQFTKTKTWSRDESLTNVVAWTYVSPKDALTSQIYREITEEESMSVLQAYKYRVGQSLRRLRNYLFEKKFSVGAIVKEFFEEDDEATALQKDASFGFLKYLIIATKAGRIAALDIRTGEPLWHYDTGLSNIIKLQAIRSETELTVFTKSGTTLLFDITSIKSNPFLLSQSQIASAEFVEDLGEEKAFLLKTRSGKRTVMQDGLSSASSDFFLLDHDEKTLSASVYQNKSVVNTWEHNLENEEIIAFASRTQSPLVNLGNILGNRTVLYKYLYPHLAAYASKAESGALSVRIIDTITGELVYTALHDDKVDYNLPVNLVFGEHWCIYTYFSLEPVPEQKIAVLELYESLTPNERISVPDAHTDALVYPNKPQVIQKSYFYPEVIKNIGLTHTKFGITTKAVILELENGQMTILPKYILSARRLEESEMSADDKKEFMAVPYISAIPINDNAIITHKRRLLPTAKSQLASIPTELESTSIVCNLGHDLFCTRVSPSSQFDKLSPSFEKGKLVSTVFGLLLVCFFLRPSVDSKKLKTRWMVKD